MSRNNFLVTNNKGVGTRSTIWYQKLAEISCACVIIMLSCATFCFRNKKLGPNRTQHGSIRLKVTRNLHELASKKLVQACYKFLVSVCHPYNTEKAKFHYTDFPVASP